jgi:hypothetical protein
VTALLGPSDVGAITDCTPDCAGAGVVSLGVRPEGADVLQNQPLVFLVGLLSCSGLRLSAYL